MKTLFDLREVIAEHDRHNSLQLWLDYVPENVEFVEVLGLDYAVKHEHSIVIDMHSYQARTAAISTRPFTGADITLEHDPEYVTNTCYRGVKGFSGTFFLPGYLLAWVFNGKPPKKLYFRRASQPPVRMNWLTASRLEKGDTITHRFWTTKGRPIHMRVLESRVSGPYDVRIRARAGRCTFTITAHTLYTVGIANRLN